MNKKSPDLHGNAPDNSPVVLLLIDVINDFEFEGAEPIFQHALPAAKKIAALKNRAGQAGIPAIYVNDNFGKWRSDLRNLVAHCLDDDTRGRPIVEMLKPAAQDYFVLKPKQSGFYSTTLDLLLHHLGARTLIMTGFTGDICVLFTAIDAHLRDYNLLVPRDCVVSQDKRENERILEYMERVLEADIRWSSEIDLETEVWRQETGVTMRRRDKRNREPAERAIDTSIEPEVAQGIQQTSELSVPPES